MTASIAFVKRSTQRLGLRPGHGRRLLPLALDAPGRASPARLGPPDRLASARREHGLQVDADLLARGQPAAPVPGRSGGRSGRRTSRTPCGTAPAALPTGCASPGRPAAIPPGCASPRPGHDPSRCVSSERLDLRADGFLLLEVRHPDGLALGQILLAAREEAVTGGAEPLPHGLLMAGGDRANRLPLRPAGP